MKALFRYPGSKWSIADWIIGHFPEGYEKMVYAPREIRLLQRWCNNKVIFGAEPDFEKYDPRKG